MIRSRSVNLFLISLCLIGIVGAGTHALLIAHLTCCGIESGSPSHHGSNKSAHDHDKCPLCQMFSGTNGKYLSAAYDTCPLVAVEVVSDILFTSQYFIQCTLTSAVPRGPPAA